MLFLQGRQPSLLAKEGREGELGLVEREGTTNVRVDVDAELGQLREQREGAYERERERGGERDGEGEGWMEGGRRGERGLASVGGERERKGESGREGGRNDESKSGSDLYFLEFLLVEKVEGRQTCW